MIGNKYFNLAVLASSIHISQLSAGTNDKVVEFCSTLQQTCHAVFCNTLSPQAVNLILENSDRLLETGTKLQKQLSDDRFRKSQLIESIESMQIAHQDLKKLSGLIKALDTNALNRFQKELREVDERIDGVEPVVATENIKRLEELLLDFRVEVVSASLRNIGSNDPTLWKQGLKKMLLGEEVNIAHTHDESSFSSVKKEVYDKLRAQILDGLFSENLQVSPNQKFDVKWDYDSLNANVVRDFLYFLRKGGRIKEFIVVVNPPNAGPAVRKELRFVVNDRDKSLTNNGAAASTSLGMEGSLVSNDVKYRVYQLRIVYADNVEM